MGFSRVRVITQGKVKIKDTALGQKAWPEFEQRLSNCFHNQLETPILFYLAVILCNQLKIQSDIILFLSYLFIFCRFGHAYVEIKTNHVPSRFKWFLAGTTSLLIIWSLIIYFWATMFQ
jgi:hypothetical protein